jgi:hypothetical protein
MTTVGNEIWVGNALSPEIFRIDSSGNPLGPIFAPFPFDIGGMTTVGNEIWVGSAISPEIFRLDSSGNPLGPIFAPLPYGEIGGMTTVVPIPPALWLFGSGMLGLVGMARRKKAA